jgi:hypothetical protein
MTEQNFVSNLGNCDLFEIWGLGFGACPLNEYHPGNQSLVKDNFTLMRLFKHLARVHDSIGI